MSQRIYPEFKKLDFPAFEQEVLAYWKAERIFQQSIDNRNGRENFVFYEGPPSANGMPGIHHVISRTIKDIFCRYKTLQGYKVDRKGGWDTHGLPVELQVEKKLGITKEDIGTKISIEDYNKACREDVLKFKDIWDQLTERIGYWVDLDNPYITYENKYIESLWYLLKQLHQKDLLYKGYTIQPFSPAAGTGLSSHELNQPGTYKPVKDTTIVAMFKALQPEQHGLPADTHFLAWTTTPWTLPSNTALAVGEKIDYVLVQTFNPYTGIPCHVILAEALLGKYFKPEGAEAELQYDAGAKLLPYRIVKQLKGKDLSGIRYEQLLPYAQPATGDAFRVVIGDFVSTEDGTGIVHIAPSFGADDFRVANQYGIGALTLVDKVGRFTNEVTDFAHEYVKEAYLSEAEKEAERQKQGRDKYLSVDERISIKLKTENKAFKVEKYEHTYPHCWRTDKPILYYPLESWFIKTTAVKDRLIALNKTINWIPESTGTGRFGNWLENLVDWNLSRSRYWGTPLPIWRTLDGSEEKCIGSIEELKAEIKKANEKLGVNQDPEQATLDLHRPFVDNITLVSDSGQPMKRETDLIDVWFDSGAMPYAQWNYPNGRDNLQGVFPADFIAEGVDQTRGWFFTLHALSVMLFDSVAYKNVVANGLVLDKHGNKMSKRLGNVVDPFETVNKYGADAVRWYLLSNSSPWENLKFDLEGVTETQRKFLGTLYNTYSFFAIYANIDAYTWQEEKAIPLAQRTELDRWILSRLNSLILKVQESMDAFDPTPATRAIEEFVSDHLSNWYVRLGRRRFWKGEMTADKQAAYHTLYTCLRTVSQLMSPFAPFMADWLYRNLNQQQSSVHLTDYPAVQREFIDQALEERMEMAQDISSMVLSLRKKTNIKVRQPLQKVLVPVFNESIKAQLEQVKDLILSEVNVKELAYLSADNDVIVKRVKPNFKLLGPRAGAHMKDLAQLVNGLSREEITQLEQQGQLALNLGGAPFTLNLSEVEVTTDDIPGWQVTSNGKLTVALDIIITDSLKSEGLARELVSKIQNLRKDRGLQVTDRINVQIQTDTDWVRSAIQTHQPYICAEVLAQQILLTGEQLPPAEIEELSLGLDIQKI